MTGRDRERPRDKQANRKKDKGRKIDELKESDRHRQIYIQSSSKFIYNYRYC